MFLNDGAIRAAALAGMITPFDEAQLQPASYDLRASGWWRGLADEYEWPRTTYTLYPGEFILGCTAEVLHIPADLVCDVAGKSTLARKGLGVHLAGYVDPGFRGQVTLELHNVGTEPVTLTAGMRIAQARFVQMVAPAEKPYGEAGNHYQGQMGPTPAAV